MSQRYVYILCVLLNYPMTVLRKDQERASLWRGGLLLLFREDKLPPNVILCSPKFLWSLGSGGFHVVVKAVSGGGGRGCVFFIPDPLRTQCFINLLTSICTYKQCLQRNTFTCVDWLVHNYSYLERHGKLSVASHINNVSNPSHSMVHWPRVWRVI